jgi:hypothetical protein
MSEWDTYEALLNVSEQTGKPVVVQTNATNQSAEVIVQASSNGLMYQQFDILQRIQDINRKDMEERIDREIIEHIKNKLGGEDEIKHSKFQELCSKLKNKHRKNRK